MEPRGLIFRVFVSSTFSDLVAERNALQEHVFPRLRELCRKNGARFQAIDLRWGVSEEASLDQQAMSICLRELKRCQKLTPCPNFVLLLGDRYGWLPLPENIPANEHQEIECRLSDAAEAALLTRWYKRDDNALYEFGDESREGTFVLQPREARFAEYDVWDKEVQRPLRAALNRAVSSLDLTPEARLKYEASATHQEIYYGTLKVRDTSDHAFGFFRTIRGLPEDASARNFVDLDEHNRLDRDAQERLRSLKKELRERLPARVHDYEVEWRQGMITTAHIGTLPADFAACQAMLANDYEPLNLCEAVWCRLGRVIREEVRCRGHFDPVEQEALAHIAFAKDSARDFIGREDALTSIGEYMQADSRHPLVLHGVSGVGKSALMAKAVERVGFTVRGSQVADAVTDSTESRTDNHELVVRYIGATPASSDLRALLQGLCKEVTLRYGGDLTSVPVDVRKLEREFPERLALATAEKPLLLFLDALNQINITHETDITESELRWLPTKLPPYVHVVCSTTPGPVLDALQSRLPESSFRQLGALPRDDGRALLEKWLSNARRRLTAEQHQAVLSGFGVCGLPLYLRLAFEEARNWRSYETPSTLPRDVDGMVDRLFDRLSKEANHGPLLVDRAVSYLRCSRYGSSEDEMLDLLARDSVYWQHFLDHAHHDLPAEGGQPVRRLPIVIWSRFYHDMERYLSWRSVYGVPVMGFFHRETFERVADRRFLHDESVLRQRHADLADYSAGWELGPRKIDELPWQLLRAADFKRLYDLLQDVPFFGACFDHDSTAAKSYWVTLERERGFRMVEAYRPAIDDPRAHLEGIGAVAELLNQTAHWEEFLRLSQGLAEHYRRKGDTSHLTNVLGNLAFMLIRKGDHVAAEKVLDEMRHLPEGNNNYELLNNEALLGWERGNLSEAVNTLIQLEKVVRMGIQAASDCMSTPELARATTQMEEMLEGCLIHKSFVLHEWGRYAEALRVLEEAKRLAQEGNRRDAYQAVLGEMAVNYGELGDIDRELTLLEEQAKICRELGDFESLAGCLGNQGKAYLGKGDLVNASALFESMEQIGRQIGHGRLEHVGRAGRAHVCFHAGDVPRAAELAKGVSEYFRKSAMTGPLSNSLQLDGEIAIVMGNVDAAGKCYEEAADLREQMGCSEIAAEMLRTAATALITLVENWRFPMSGLSSGKETETTVRRYDRAPQMVEMALRLLKRAAGIQPSSAEIQAALGQALESRGDFSQAIAAYDAALNLRPGWTEIEIRRLLQSAIGKRPNNVGL